MDGTLLNGLGQQFEAWPDANLHAVLIVRHGAVIYERYFTGEDRAWATPLGRVSYHAGLKHDLRSITKSVTSLLFGIAVERGWVASLDSPIFTYFPDHADLRTGEKDKIVLRHLLTMAAGLAWNETLPYSNPANSERKMIEASDPYRYVLWSSRSPDRREKPTLTMAGSLRCLRQSCNGPRSGRLTSSRAMSCSLRSVSKTWNGSDIRAATRTQCPACGCGRAVSPSSGSSCDGGVWNGKRIISSAWLDQSLAPQINGEGLYFYGFQWWLGRSLVERKEITWAAAFGYGGQRMFIVPRLGLVAVVMAGLYDNPALQSVVGEIVLRRYALAAVTGE